MIIFSSFLQRGPPRIWRVAAHDNAKVACTHVTLIGDMFAWLTMGILRVELCVCVVHIHVHVE